MPSKREARKALDLAEDARVVCFSGLDVLIDLPLVMRAFDRIRHAQADAVLLLVGPSVAVSRALVRSVRELERTICTGPVPYRDLPKYLAAADVFLMPYTDKISNIGRWPNKIGDYMCVGRPTVSNPVGEVKWLFEQFHIGTLAEETAESMADATLTLLRDPSRTEEIGRRARTLAEEVFAWDRLIEVLEHWYYDILSMPALRRRPALAHAAAEA
jgi:phosphatidylinositol alpha-1,6-mannosyltransferase